MIKKMSWIASVVFVVFMGWIAWNHWIRPTRIALVNYSDFQVSRFMGSNDSPWISIHSVKLNDSIPTDLSTYDLVLSWSHGVPFTEGVRSGLRHAIAKGVSVYCVGATSAENDLTHLEEPHLKPIESFIENGGQENFKRLYAYVRKNIQGAILFAADTQEPIDIPDNVFFHLNETYFGSYTDYQNYRIQQGLNKPNAPRIAFFTSNLGPRNSGRSDIDSIIMALEAKKLNVFPIDGFTQRLEMLDSVQPDLVLSMPHGRFVPGQEKKVLDYFKKRNIPLLTPIKVFQEYNTWLKDQRGMDGGSLGQSVVVPELDGAIESFVTAAQFKNADGYTDFQAIPGRAERLARRVSHWIHLKKAHNSEKKVTIIYLKGPGQNALVAGGLEVLPSLYNMLKKMKSDGYTITGLPSTLEAFSKLIRERGMVPGPYAQGTIAHLIQNNYPARIPVATYTQWAENALTPKMWESVIKEYGPAPGPYLSIPEGDSAAILVNRIELGNIALMPQPLPGYGDNEFALVHGSPNPPPHPYIAAYLWASEGFHSDAIIHFGTHGSFEFLPSKQVALSDNDWPDALIKDMPHGYVYIINNIGEAIMAKRRGYATMLSHLTPPFMASDLYAELQELHDKLHHYLLPNLDPVTKSQYAQTLKSLVLQMNLDKDLSFTDLSDRDLHEDEIQRIHNHVHSIELEKVGRGLYVLGRPYTEAEAIETALLMHVDAIAFSFAELDIAKGLVSRSILENKHEFVQKYREPAYQMVQQVLNKPLALSSILSASDLEKLNQSDSLEFHKRNQNSHSSPIETVDTSEIAEILTTLALDSSHIRFIRSWESKREFQRVANLLDPATRARFTKAATFMPEMKQIAFHLDAPGMLSLIQLATQEKTRQQILTLLDNTELRKRITTLRTQKIQSIIDSLHAPDQDSFYALLKQPESWNMAQPSDSVLDILRKQTQRALQHFDSIDKKKRPDKNQLERFIEEITQEQGKRAAFNDHYLHTLKTLREAIQMIPQSRDNLVLSNSLELNSILNMLSGGFIPPSPGGDPVSNPHAIPTGRNLYAINAENTPTRESWEIGKRMVQTLLNNELKNQGKYPRKVALTLWGGEFVRDQGVTIAQAFYLMGVEPVWNSRGRMHDVKLIPMEELERPRIDVVVQTSGQFRDMGASRLYLLNKAVRLASEAPLSEENMDNFVRMGSIESEKELLSQGNVSPARAAKISRIRTFGGLNGNYGTGIMGLVEAGDQWDNEKQIQDRYIQNMGAFYDQEEWGSLEKGAFTAALRHTEVVLQSRSSNTTGPISLDHTYEFMGGINAAIRGVTGKDPRAFFTDTRNRYQPVVQNAKEAVWIETRSTLLNPKYVKELIQEGETAAELFAEAFRNTYGWEVMKPEMIDDALWESYVHMFVDDKHQTGIKNFMAKENPFAYQEMTAVMLETIRKGYWNASAETIQKLADEHTTWVGSHGAGCSGFVCDNPKLKSYIQSKASPKNRKAYDQKVNDALQSRNSDNAIQMKKTEQNLRSTALPPTQLALIWFLLVGFGLIPLYIWIHRKQR